MKCPLLFVILTRIIPGYGVNLTLILSVRGNCAALQAVFSNSSASIAPGVISLAPAAGCEARALIAGNRRRIAGGDFQQRPPRACALAPDSSALRRGSRANAPPPLLWQEGQQQQFDLIHRLRG